MNFTGHATVPTLCRKHMDVVLLGSQAARRGWIVTAQTLEMAYRALPDEVRFQVSFRPDEIRGLVDEMRRSATPLPDSFKRTPRKEDGK